MFRNLVAIAAVILTPVSAEAEDAPTLNECAELTDSVSDIKKAPVCLGVLLAEITELSRRIDGPRQHVHKTDSIPSSAILLSTQPCEDFSWFTLEETIGRFPIGAGNFSTELGREDPIRFGRTPDGEPDGTQLKPYRGDPYIAMDIGGSESVRLTGPQMPIHKHQGSRILPSHRVLQNDDVETGRSVVNTGHHDRHVEVAPGGIPVNISQAGGDEPHPNMPPYIALYFCKKN